MTGLLQKALCRIEGLSEEEQNAIAMQILESLDDEETWGQIYLVSHGYIRRSTSPSSRILPSVASDPLANVDGVLFVVFFSSRHG